MKMSVEELEKLRKKIRNKKLIGYGIVLVVTIFVLIYVMLPPVIMITLILGILVVNLVCGKQTRQFKLSFKSIFVESTLKNIFTNIKYEPENGMDENVIANTRMMNMGDRYDSNDYIKAKYKGINFEQADVHIQKKEETRDSNGNTHTHYVTIFMGKWMIFDFNKNFKANVQVCSKRFTNSRVNSLFQKDKLEKVELEDIDFNKKFRIYAQNEHDAFYILTPSMMEKIKRVKENTNGELLLCFIDNRLHVGLQNGKDSFEHGIFTKIDENKIIENLSIEMKTITQFVDELNLDNDLFRREV